MAAPGITALAFRPYFAAELTAGTYTLRVVTAGPTNTDVSIVVGAGLVWNRSDSDTASSIGAVVAAAINASAAPGTWSWGTVTPSTSVGVTAFLRSTVPFTIDYAATPGTKFDLTWLGITNANHTAVAAISGLYHVASTTPPARTWFPKVLANDLGRLPTPIQVTHTPLTSDGSRCSVVMSPVTSPPVQWHSIVLDGGPGVFGGRLQTYRAAQSAWATAGGFSAGAPFVALDDDGGWWAYAARGTRFVMGDEAAADEFVGWLSFSTAPENPEAGAIAAAAGLRPPFVVVSGAAQGRRNIRAAFLVSAYP